MKTSLRLLGIVMIAVGAWSLVPAAESASAVKVTERVGVYDSRAVAYAHFWSPEVERTRNAAVAEAKVAKAAGDTAATEAKSRSLADYQKRMHEQVFGSAPATDAMAALAARLPALQRELGVDRVVSKWDVKVLKDVPEAQRVDVTDRLVREFIVPNEKQQKVLDSMKTTKPVSSLRLKMLHLFGGA
ncbi:MAG: hypothetical protein NTV51_28570 [Verrucomicrobia bacterium]|nr:hypothetical protein [Verrucomicrobiota bacterium]